MENINSGDTAWVLASAALVMLMTPALGFFYGGLVRRKNVLSTIMHSLKSYTAHEINKLLKRSGTLWQSESYDHWLRDEDELATAALQRSNLRADL